MTALRRHLAAAGYAAGWRLVQALPAPAARRLFEYAGEVAVRRDGPGVRRLRANLARVVPDAALDDTVRAGMRSYARYWCEAFRLPSMDPATVHAVLDPLVTGGAPAFSALDAGRGVIFALPHSGNWDVAGVWMVESLRRRGAEPAITTVVERLAPQALFRRFVAYRETLGFEVLAADDGSAVHRALTRRLRGGGVVALVADRDLTGSGIDVAFLGGRARLPAGPARLAALTGALLLPAFPHFTPDGWALTIAEPVAVDRSAIPAATQSLADAFGALIVTAPQDWHMLQPLCSDVPEPVTP